MEFETKALKWIWPNPIQTHSTYTGSTMERQEQINMHRHGHALTVKRMLGEMAHTGLNSTGMMQSHFFVSLQFRHGTLPPIPALVV